MQLNNSRVSLASWSPGPSPGVGVRSATSSPAASPHTPPPHAHLVAHPNATALKVRRNFISNPTASPPEYQPAPPSWSHPHKLHPLRNALAYPLPLLQVCNNQLTQLGLGEDGMTTKKPCRCPPEEPVHEYSAIIGPPPHHPHKAALAASTEPLYWSPILKRAAGGGAGGAGSVGGGGGGGGNAAGDEGTLKKGWSGTSRVFKYIVQRRGNGKGRPRRGWRWLLWLLGAVALTVLMAIGLAAYLTSGKCTARPPGRRKG